MSQLSIRRLHRVTALVTLIAVVFWLFFQIGKVGPFRDINPFGNDPYDAVGSIAVQLGLAAGILTYARALRLIETPSQAGKARLIARGNGLVLGAILLALAADSVAVVMRPQPHSVWRDLLLGGLAAMCLLALFGAAALIRVLSHLSAVEPPRDLTPADGIDDLWTLARFLVKRADVLLPAAWVRWVTHLTSDALFARLPWLNPRTHQWRFACALGLTVGMCFAVAQLREGLPTRPETALVAAGILISVEFALTVLGFAVLGRYLGLRASSE